MSTTDAGTRHLTADEVADRLAIPRWCIYDLAKKGTLPHLRIGRRLRFREESIRAWEEAKEQGGAKGGEA